jgi:hypothetical protein
MARESSTLRVSTVRATRRGEGKERTEEEKTDEMRSTSALQSGPREEMNCPFSGALVS